MDSCFRRNDIADALGSVSRITDSTGARYKLMVYSSFGRMSADSGSVQADIVSYTGREAERDLGIYYYRARHFDPLTGRFTSRDPLGTFPAADVNPYRYVGNEPTGFTAPFGLSANWGGLNGVGGSNGDNTNVIIVQRTWETDCSTISTFSISNSTVTGYIMEPPGGTPQQAVTENSGVRIQAGTYTFNIFDSPKFDYDVLQLDVPHRPNVEIHRGNYPWNTTGCLLPGTSREPDRVWHSEAALDQIIQTTGGSGTIIIRDPIAF